MKYREIKPIGFLTNFIQSFWEYETFSTEFEHTIIPDGYFDLIVEFENNSFKQIKLTGVWIMPINVVIPKSTKLFGIRFKLLAAEYIFQREIKSILNTNIILHDTFWNISSYQTNDFEIFVSEISNYLENSIKHFKEIDNRKLKLFELVYQRQNLSID